jgi:hypothetical protein
VLNSLNATAISADSESATVPIQTTMTNMNELGVAALLRDFDA